jgi:hypothetical protein
MKFAKLSLAVLAAAFLAGCAANEVAGEKTDKQGQCCAEGSAAGKECCADGSAAKTGACCSESGKAAGTEKAAPKN